MNLAVFASGRGSNFQAILRAIDDGSLPVRVPLVLSNRSDAGVLDIARTRNIPAIHCSQNMFATEDAFAAQMLALLREHRCEAIALAGYMKKIPRAVIEEFRRKILNIHPALLPSFGGAGMYGHFVHEAVIASGAKISGATVHVVDEEYDRGPILIQRTVPVTIDDTPETLAARVLSVEHEIYPLGLQALAEGRIQFKEHHAWIT
jgi:phosphoribosylglycinamide formyltransferase-1